MSNQDKSFNEPKIQLTLNIMKQDNEITYHMDNNDEIAAAHDIALLLNYHDNVLDCQTKGYPNQLNSHYDTSYTYVADFFQFPLFGISFCISGLESMTFPLFNPTFKTYFNFQPKKLNLANWANIYIN